MAPILDVRHLQTHFHTEDGVVRAVDDVSFTVEAGETVALVGESGCGKSVTALSVMRLVSPPGRIVSGEILFDGTDLVGLPEEDMRRIRGNDIAMIFQEPMTSLNPVFTVGDQIAEAITLHQGLPRAQAMDEAARMLDKVAIPDATKRVRDYPHQMSGGMRQRVMIAMALSCNPKLLIADEPTTALDVTIQAQILDILNRLQEEYQLSVLMITHDLGVVAETCRRVVVMYTGRVVEEAPVEQLFATPKHPYTQGLLRSIPKPFTEELSSETRLPTIDGNVPDLRELPPGCKFEPRCGDSEERCLNDEPPEFHASDGACRSRCWLQESEDGTPTEKAS
ncbi:MAG: ABC transporter ATP-binding protein [Acidobacteriota bacterium]